jgi:D-xylose 1-dehydrogenase (NADP+, D-xylono-1,5-lactone-forming)
MTLRWGLLSTARINDALLGGLAASDSGAAVAVASRDLARARTYAESRGIPIAHGSYEALLADPGVDAVYVSLPNALHLEWTERALNAGKHVLCEKPMGRDPVRVAAAFALAQERGLVLSEAFMYRHHPQTIRLAQLVADGAIGPLRSVRSHFSFLLTDSEDVRLSATLEGGALMDLGCYCVSAARLLAGEPESFAGVHVRGGERVDVSFAGAMRFGGGVVAAFEASFRSAAGYGLQVTGETGALCVADPWHIHGPGIELVADGGQTRRIEVQAADSYRLEVEDLARAVAGEEPARVARDDAVGQARALQGLYAAAGAI